jgi:hypothetical protein
MSAPTNGRCRETISASLRPREVDAWRGDGMAEGSPEWVGAVLREDGLLGTQNGMLATRWDCIVQWSDGSLQVCEVGVFGWTFVRLALTARSHSQRPGWARVQL